MGHYLLAGLLRVACDYMKRHAEGTAWGDYTDQDTISIMNGIMEEVERDNPVQGRWHVPKTEKRCGIVWCDASSITIGVCVKIGGIIAEDIE